MLFTGLVWLDKAVALAMSVVIIYNGYKIIRKSLAGIMDEADMDLLKDIVVLLNNNRKENWIDLHNLRVIKFGPVLHIDCHLTVPWYMNVHQAHDEIDALTDLIKMRMATASNFLYIPTDASTFRAAFAAKKIAMRKHPFEQKVEWTLLIILSPTKNTRSDFLINYGPNCSKAFQLLLRRTLVRQNNMEQKAASYAL